jgi:hypothetical protein
MFDGLRDWLFRHLGRAAGPGRGVPARQMRVFISSTFRDMQADREVLVKQACCGIRVWRTTLTSTSATPLTWIRYPTNRAPISRQRVRKPPANSGNSSRASLTAPFPFAASRRRVYIGREEDFEKLDRHVAADGPPLAVLGEPGSGKSALLAN